MQWLWSTSSYLIYVLYSDIYYIADKKIRGRNTLPPTTSNDNILVILAVSLIEAFNTTC